jgi:hypothetical protein
VGGVLEEKLWRRHGNKKLRTTEWVGRRREGKIMESKDGEVARMVKSLRGDQEPCPTGDCKEGW